jgi:translation elongation factor EF-Ts
VEIPATLVKKLRDMTGAGMMECKAALQEANGVLEDAQTILRKRGLAQAAKKTGRSTSEGLIGSYIHAGGKIGVLVELNCESDFVARTDDFQNLLKELALQVAAASPTYARREDVPAEILERERSIYRRSATRRPRSTSCSRPPSRSWAKTSASPASSASRSAREADGIWISRYLGLFISGHLPNLRLRQIFPSPVVGTHIISPRVGDRS